MMEKNAYLIIPDLHLGDLTTPNRVSYRNELEHVQKYLVQTALKYKGDGWNVIALLLGDVYHNSYKSVFPAIVDHDFFTLWREKIGSCYSVIGNHELSYYQSNPFYTLVSNIQSERIQKIKNKVWQPLGAIDIIQVPDILQDGEVTFYFNHYGTGVQPASPNGISIGLFHQDIIDRQILEDAEKDLGTRLFANAVNLEESDLFTNYQHCFFGHLHQVYGKWKMGGTMLWYLASLGRTNINEVRNDFLERCIPVVKIIDGEFEGIDDNYCYLPEREKCIFEEVVYQQKVENERKAIIHEMRTYTPMGDAPIKNLMTLFAEEPKITDIIIDLQSNEHDRRFIELKRKLRYYGIEN